MPSVGLQNVAMLSGIVCVASSFVLLALRRAALGYVDVQLEALLELHPKHRAR